MEVGCICGAPAGECIKVDEVSACNISTLL